MSLPVFPRLLATHDSGALSGSLAGSESPGESARLAHFGRESAGSESHGGLRLRVGLCDGASASANANWWGGREQAGHDVEAQMASSNGPSLVLT